MLSEGHGIQRQSIWCADLSYLARSSNQINETNQIDQKDQMRQIPATCSKMVPGTFSFFWQPTPGLSCWLEHHLTAVSGGRTIKA